MGYPVSKGNSVQFVIGDERLAFAVVLDDFINQFQFGLFRLAGSGEWQCPVYGDTNGYIESNLTNEKIMAYGSVAAFIESQFPAMKAKLESYLGAIIPKPDRTVKPACVGYDLARDVEFIDGEFRLNKSPPLSHAL